MEQEYKYMVCTSCMTFNHAPFIVDAMNGFVMQETTFPAYYLITDDASTDGEQEVIRQYLSEHFQEPYRTEETDDYHLFCAVHKSNPNCIFVVFFLKYNHYSIKKPKLPYQSEWRDNAKYIAICEGDDYWIHPKKLQMQVEFLNNHQDYGLIHTRHYNSINGKIKKVKGSANTRLENVLVKPHIATLTTCFRNSLYRHYITEIQPHKRKWLMGDAPLWYYLSFHSKIKYIEEYTSVYRILPESASHSKNKEKNMAFAGSAYEIRLFFAQRYLKSHLKYQKVVKKIQSYYCYKIINIHLQYNDIEDAKKEFLSNKKVLSFSHRVKSQIKMMSFKLY